MTPYEMDIAAMEPYHAKAEVKRNFEEYNKSAAPFIKTMCSLQQLYVTPIITIGRREDTGLPDVRCTWDPKAKDLYDSCAEFLKVLKRRHHITP